MSNISIVEGSTIARPLHVLETLILKEIKSANEAAELASLPYWKRIGDLLVEAQCSGKGMTIAELAAWANQKFTFSRSYMLKLKALATSTIDLSRARSYSDAMRATGQQPRGAARGGIRVWRQDVDAIADKARSEALRLSEEELTRQQDRAAKSKLGLRLIDIGYKVLAQELHPDKVGGSREAMARLNWVRDRLKANV